MSHTPGPWYATRDSVYCRVDGPQEWIASMNDADFRYQELSEEEADNEMAANARLIAAAPELYEAAKAFVRAWESGYSGTVREREALNAAVDKAEGKEGKSGDGDIYPQR